MERLIVDAMNVIGSRPTGWWRDRAAALRRFVSSIRELVNSESAIELTLVVDGQPVDGLPENVFGSLRVLYATSHGPDAADDLIVRLVAADDEPTSLVIVSSDRALRERVRALGAEVVGVGSLLRRLDALSGEETPACERP